MNCLTKQLLCILIGLAGVIQKPAAASPCLRLTGKVIDYDNHNALVAQLYAETEQGRLNLGTSDTKTGQFTVMITCPATALVVEKVGYRPQTLPLNITSISLEKSVGIIVPLIVVDQRGINRPFFQSQQIYFIQKNNKQASIQPQHNLFIISDAFTNRILSAQICFTFTKTGDKKCIETDKAGQISIDFTEKDIVALDITSPGYQAYAGNQIVEKGDSRQLHHDIRLTRTLTIFSLQVASSEKRYELFPQGELKKGILLEMVPGVTNTAAAYDLLPQKYTLVITSKEQNEREQKSVTIQPGLNMLTISPQPQIEPASALKIVAPVSRPDSALRFEQSSYTLLPDSKTLLTQIAAYLVQYQEIGIQITGHTDREGDEKLNRGLSEFRAKVVSTFLENHGVADKRIEIVGVGSRFPIAPSDTEENRAKNRRVTIKFLTKK